MPVKIIVYACGYGRDLAKTIWGQPVTEWTRLENNPYTIDATDDHLKGSLRVLHVDDEGFKCKVTGFPGIVVYHDGEAGRIPNIGSHKKVLYAGIIDPLEIERPSEIELVGSVFFPFLSRMYGKNIFKNGTIYRYAGEKEFEKEKVFLMAYQYFRCRPSREKLYDLIVRYAEEVGLPEAPRAIGRCYGSRNETVFKIQNDSRVEWTMADSLVKFKFVIAIENSLKLGYLTEKLWRAIHAGAIPLYYGSKQVFDLFNPKSIIFLEFGNIKNAMMQVKYLLENPDELVRMRQMFPFHSKQHAERLSLNYNSPLARSVRSAVYGHASCPEPENPRGSLVNLRHPFLCYSSIVKTSICSVECTQEHTAKVWTKVYKVNSEMFQLNHKGSCLTVNGPNVSAIPCSHKSDGVQLWKLIFKRRKVMLKNLRTGLCLSSGSGGGDCFSKLLISNCNELNLESLWIHHGSLLPVQKSTTRGDRWWVHI